MNGRGAIFCSWHEALGEVREARWIVEVYDPDGHVIQRLAACDATAKEVFVGMKVQPPYMGDTYSTLRRLLPSDSILEFSTFESQGAS